MTDTQKTETQAGAQMPDAHKHDDAYWRQRLTAEQYQVVRLKGTERPFSSALDHLEANGMYTCVACGAPLFSSDTKFDSGSGWPSFDAPVNREHVELHTDTAYGMVRTEVTCKNCGAHLGHVFPDGPRETTGERYCINGVSLAFTPGK